MKKTLAAVAVLGAFAGSALAADVQLYGVVDLGLNYSHVDMDGNGDDIDSFTMDSGNGSGSRWGIKGTEDLGNGLTVGFILVASLLDLWWGCLAYFVLFAVYCLLNYKAIFNLFRRVVRRRAPAAAEGEAPAGALPEDALSADPEHPDIRADGGNNLHDEGKE